MPPVFVSSQQTAETLAARQQATPEFGSRAEVEEWTLTGPLPSRTGFVVAPTTEWEQALTSGSDPGTKLTSSMLCAARETGLVLAAHGSFPSRRLEDFIHGRCAVSGEVAYESVLLDPAESLSLGESREGMAGQIAELLPVGWTQAGDEIGIWVGSASERDVLLVARTRPLVELQSASVTGFAGVSVTGRVLIPVDGIRVLANLGERGVRECDLTVIDGPLFEAECSIIPEDKIIRLEIVAAGPAGSTGPSLLRILLARLGSETMAFHMWPSEPPSVAAQEPAAIGAAINRAREDLELAPLRLDEAQSAVAVRLTPTYLAALLGQLDDVSIDTVSEVLAAGWDVVGEVGRGNVTFEWLDGTHSAEHLVTAALEWPRGRSILLDPDADAVALGVWRSETQDALALLAGVYHVQDETGLERRLRDQLNAIRAQQGLPPARRLRHEDMEGLVEDALAEFATEQTDPGATYSDLVDDIADETSHDTSVVLEVVSDLGDVEYSDALRIDETINLIAGVGSWQPENSPWRLYVVAMVNVGGRVRVQTQPRIWYETFRNGGAVLARNPGIAPVTISLDFGELRNATVSGPPNFTSILQPGEEVELAELRHSNPYAGWSTPYTVTWRWGSAEAQHDDSVLYELPYPPGTAFRVSQGYFGDRSHQDKHALDFALPEGTPIHAARSGLVIEVIEYNNEVGTTPEFLDEANAVRVLHDDGSIASYGHLQQHGVRVRVGDRVATGDVLAASGNTGYSTGPHLHFEILLTVSGTESVTTSVLFRTAEGEGIVLEEGHRYTRPR